MSSTLMMLSLLSFFFLLSSICIGTSQPGRKDVGCDVSDERLIYRKDVLCSSLGESTVTVSNVSLESPLYKYFHMFIMLLS